MMTKHSFKVLVLAMAAIAIMSCQASADTMAFPSAEGYGGASTVGGRGGDVYHVTSLADTDTPGTLRYGWKTAGGTSTTGRTIVFDISGTITLASKLLLSEDAKSYVTIAGQTAPGDGITIKGLLATSADNLIIRYIRVRQDPAAFPDDDAIGTRYHSNLVFDHVSASWSTDEVFSLYHNQYTTVQWCIAAEGCPKGGGHRFGGIFGNNYGTWHHNLLAHNDNRNPRWASGSQYNDYRNNVIYNWGYGSCNGGGAVQEGQPQFDHTTINMVANYYKYGPATGPKDRIADPYSDNGVGSWWVSDNYVYGSAAVTNNNWLGMAGGDYSQLPGPWPAMAISCEETAQNAYNSVLDHVGCSFPKRDRVDDDIIDDATSGTAKYGNGIINSPSDVGGWPTLETLPAPLDTDQDGMPDAWETARALDPDDADDRNYYTLNADYTNLEMYLEWLPISDIPDTTAPTPDPMTWQAPPQPLSATQIKMTATTAMDISSVEYYFDCTAGGGNDSGWQASPTYVDSGLTEGQSYTYRAQARDKSPANNETGWSTSESATPEVDETPPVPDPMTWENEPNATGPYSIIMTATSASDVNGVEYFFDCTAGGGNDSGWQDSATYTDTGLTPDTTYTYRVKARDKSIAQNETGWSTSESATTPAWVCTEAIDEDLNGDCQVNMLDYSLLAGNWTGGAVTPASLHVVDLPSSGTDAATGISTSKTYTHTLNFNATSNVTINGVDFLGAGNTGTSLQGKGFNLVGSTGTASGTPHVSADGDTRTMLETLIFHSAAGVGTSISAILSDLTPGTTYSMRIYYWQWGTDRTIDISADGDSHGVFDDTLSVDIDAGGSHYVEYIFMADDTDVAIQFECTVDNNGAHLYGLSNEVLSEPKPTMNNLRVLCENWLKCNRDPSGACGQ